jgi:tripartite ATP-independent transporter DctM subunit
MTVDGPSRSDGSSAHRTRWADVIQRCFEWADRALETVAGLILLAVVAIVLLGVFSRYVLNLSVPWTEEVALLGFLWLIVIGAAAGTGRGLHASMDSLAVFLPPGPRAVLEFAIDTVVAATCVMLLLSGSELVLQSHGTTPVLSWPNAVRFAAIPVGAALNLLFLAGRPQFGRRSLGVLAVVAGAVLYGGVLTTGLITVVAEWVGPSVMMMVTFGVLLVAGVPAAFAMIAGAFLAAWGHDLLPPAAVALYIAAGSESFIYVAIPLFILAGALMNYGGVTESLVNLAIALVGHFRGGLAHVNVVATLLLSGLSGSSSADAAAITRTLVPVMTARGYGAGFSTALSAASSVAANTVPPAISMLIFAYLASVSVGKLFLAGYIPGAMMGLSLMVAVHVICRRRGYGPPGPRSTARQLFRAGWRALPALGLPVLILGGIAAGIVTATEAGALGALYALVVGFYPYRDLTLPKLWESVTQTALDTAGVCLILIASAPFAWVLIAERIPQQLTAWMLGLSSNPFMLLFLINVILFLVGLPVEPAPAMLILVPLFLPVIDQIGVDRVHFGIIVIANLMIGAITPPVGSLVFITATIARTPLAAVFREIMPFTLIMLLVVLMLTYMPFLSLWLPNLIGKF